MYKKEIYNIETQFADFQSRNLVALVVLLAIYMYNNLDVFP